MKLLKTLLIVFPKIITNTVNQTTEKLQMVIDETEFYDKVNKNFYKFKLSILIKWGSRLSWVHLNKMRKVSCLDVAISLPL
jgi:putative cell wall-binding protein